MRFLKATPLALGVVLLAAAFSPRVTADSYDHMTTITFSGPVEIPPVYVTGMKVLPAGTYVFKLVNSSNDRHIIQIFNQDQSRIYATILAIPNYRLTPTGKTVMTFNEGIAGKPEALRAWFYPGASWGEEFVYPKDKAVELAQVAKAPVLAAVADVKLEVEKPEAPEVLDQLRQLPIMAVRPTGEVVEVAQVIQTAPPQARPIPATIAAAPAPAPASAPASAPGSTLPATATEWPLIAFCGFVALIAGLALVPARKRIK